MDWTRFNCTPSHSKEGLKQNLDQWESYRAHKLADAPELVLPETIGLKKA